MDRKGRGRDTLRELIPKIDAIHGLVSNPTSKMDSDDSIQSEVTTKAKKPGPRRTKCIWCGSTECTHCRCTGQTGCNHRKGEMCPNARYKRRLVCNSCEKNKLKEKNHRPDSASAKRKRQRAAPRASKKHASSGSTATGNASKKAAMSSENEKDICLQVCLDGGCSL